MRPKINAFFPRRRAWRIVTVLFVIVVLMFLAWKFFFSKPDLPQYLTAPVSRETLTLEVLASGTLKPIRQVDVGAQVSGQLKKLHIQAGSQVRQGQLLAEIDPELALNELKAAQATLEHLLAQKEGLLAELQQARLELTRQQAMARDESTSQKALQAAQAGLTKQEAARHALEAQIRGAQSNCDKAKTNLSYSRIVAPMAGEVISINTLEGQTVNAVQQVPVILKLANLSSITVRAQVSEADIIRVHPGMSAYFTLLGDTKQRIYGKVRSIEPQPEKINNALFYNTLFDVPNPDNRLRVDMTAQIGIVEREVKQALAIPLSALGTKDPNGRYLVQLSRKGKPLESRYVRIGLKTATRAEVLQGLKFGEQVVTRDSSKLGNDESSLTVVY